MNSSAVSSPTTSVSQKTEKSPGELGKDDFLRILVAQLSNQDPMKPMQDTEFIGQMAQFSSLEQMTNMNGTMNQFLSNQLQNSMTNYAHLIGKSVEWTESNEKSSGTVNAVVYKDGAVFAELENGKKVNVSLIERIETGE